MTHKKLQKMCYYAYAWYYTLYGERLFDNGRFEAWIHGPVNRELYLKYKDYRWKEIPQGDITNSICDDIKGFLDTIIDTFGVYDANELENMTHAEKPWKKAREGYAPDQNCEVKIDDNIIIDSRNPTIQPTPSLKRNIKAFFFSSLELFIDTNALREFINLS